MIKFLIIVSFLCLAGFSLVARYSEFNSGKNDAYIGAGVFFSGISFVGLLIYNLI